MPSYLNSRLLGSVTIGYIEPRTHYLGNWRSRVGFSESGPFTMLSKSPLHALLRSLLSINSSFKIPLIQETKHATLGPSRKEARASKESPGPRSRKVCREVRLNDWAFFVFFCLGLYALRFRV